MAELASANISLLMHLFFIRKENISFKNQIDILVKDGGGVRRHNPTTNCQTNYQTNYQTTKLPNYQTNYGYN